jgi:hypothetical protein
MNPGPAVLSTVANPKAGPESGEEPQFLAESDHPYSAGP